MDSSKELAYTDLKWAIGINRISLELVGLWPDDKLSRQQKFLADLRAIVIIITMLCISVIPGILAFLKVWGDIMAMTDNMLISLPFSINVIKFIIMWFHKKSKSLFLKIKILLSIVLLLIFYILKHQSNLYTFTSFSEDLEPVINMIKEDWLRTKTVQERDTMLKQAKIVRITVIIGCVATSFSSAILIIPPYFGYSMRYLTNLTDPGRPMLIQTYYLRYITETPYYELMITAQATSLLMGTISYTGIDTFLVMLVFHICAQLEILEKRLFKLNSFEDFNTGLSFNIESHRRLIRSVNVIDNTFNLMFVLLLMYFTIIFCVQGFLIVTIIDGGNDVSFMRMCSLVLIFINVGVHMCLFCVVGEILIARAEGIFYAVYNYTWYSRTPNEAKNLMMIMIRAEKPLCITAGKIFPMTLSMFCSLVKTSAGYISVLLANR